MQEWTPIIIQRTQPADGLLPRDTLWLQPSTGKFAYLISQGPDVWAAPNQAATVAPASSALGVPGLLTLAAASSDLSAVITTLNAVIAALKASGLMA